MGTYKENMTFEAEVRRTAEAVWNVPPGDCQPKRYIGEAAIGELDGIVRLRDLTHVVMATTSPKLDKVKEDVRKLKAAERIERKADPTKAVMCWLITEKQLDALHVKEASAQGVKIMTLNDFTRRCFDGSKYVGRRRSYPFGSAVHPKDASFALDDQRYVELPLTLESRPVGHSREQRATLDEIIGMLLSGETIVLLAPFGAGKSFTAREIFLRASKKMSGGEIAKTPVVLNLRDHWGENYGDEILERHARALGMHPKEELTVGWRAGLLTLVLDGFDEISAQVVARREDKNFMRQARASALAGVRDLVGKMPPGAGTLISGRDHYFDSESELAHSLGLLGKQFRIARLWEFDESHATEFLKNNGINQPLPDWLPRKPLLLGYLAHRGLLAGVLAIDGSVGYGYVWDQFLNLVCEREASLATSTMDPATLRLVLENLALGVRSTASGTGPIAEGDLVEAYRAVAGQSPTDAIVAQLQRLPGLTERGQTQGTRSFVDDDLLRALQGSGMARFVLHGAKFEEREVRWLDGLFHKARAMAAYLLEQSNASSAVALGRAHAIQRHGGDAQLVADCLSISLAMAKEGETIDCLGMVVEGACLSQIDLDEYTIKGLELRFCNVDEVVLGEYADKGSIQFQNCIVGRVAGVATKDGLPTNVFGEGCEVERFDNLGTNSAVVRSDLPPKVKALVTVLRKLYFQAGTGRKLSALHRGIPAGPVSAAIDEVVYMLEREGLVSVFNKIAQPVRKQSDRVRKILQAPGLSDDPLVAKLRGK